MEIIAILKVVAVMAVIILPIPALFAYNSGKSKGKITKD